MKTLFLEGGWPMYFTLVFGLIALGGAARFAKSADRRHLGFVVGMSLATLFSVLNGIVADLAAVGHHVNERWDQIKDVPMVALLGQGFAESMSPGVMGFTFLSLTWLIAAVGLSRAAKLDPK
jgi:hypothetical protein